MVARALHGERATPADAGAQSVRKRRRTVWLVLLASIVLVAKATVAGVAWMQARESIRAERVARGIERLVERRMDAYIALLRGAAALCAYDPELDRAGFARYVRRLGVEEYPGVQGIGWTERIENDQQAARVVARARADGLDTFRLWPEHGHRERHAIIFLEPLDARNRAALGFDMYSEATRREAMDRARDNGTPAASGVVRLVQEITGDVQPGFLIYVPVYEGGEIPQRLSERRARLRGFVYAPFRTGDLFEAILAESQNGIGLTIDDGTRPDATQRMFHVVSDDERGQTWSDQVEIASRVWTVSVHLPSDGITDARAMGFAIALFGAILAALVSRSAWVESRARERAELDRAHAQQALGVEARQAQFRETFLGVLGHDLRSPLAAIKMSAQLVLMQGGALEQTQRRSLERIVSSSERAIRMVSQLLDVTRERLGGGLQVDARPLQLAPLVRDVLEEAQSSHQGRRFEVDVAEDIWVRADPDRLAQILSNLASNALTHGAAPHSVQARAIEGEKVSVEVANAGDPIPSDVLATLFDPFTRGPTQRQKKREGLGLGLFISRQLAIAHGGMLDVRSDAEHGTRFELLLDRASPP